jgi:uncharacterized protein YjbI with pentapeptide repeats
MKLLLPACLLVLGFCALQSSSSPEPDLARRLRSGQAVVIENETFESGLDLTQLLEARLISGGVYRFHTASSITFRHCTFKGPVLAYAQEGPQRKVLGAFGSNVSFISCDFRAEVSFRGARIAGWADFTQCTFDGPVSFEESLFQDQAFFSACVFKRGLRMQNAVFQHKAQFLDARFEEPALFQGANFRGPLQFSVAEFFDYADFSLMHCEQGAYFNYSRFHDRAHFGRTHFGAQADFLSLELTEGVFKGCRFFGETRFQEATSAGPVDFSNCFFLLGQPDLGSFPDQHLRLTNIRG